jgi:ABC-type transporter Mla maintaining outer membrane lipid asymmetry ATPase subunit MlaF
MLHDGRIHAVGTPKEIQATADPIVRQFITGTAEIQKEAQRGTETVS